MKILYFLNLLSWELLLIFFSHLSFSNGNIIVIDDHRRSYLPWQKWQMFFLFMSQNTHTMTQFCHINYTCYHYFIKLICACPFCFKMWFDFLINYYIFFRIMKPCMLFLHVTLNQQDSNIYLLDNAPPPSNYHPPFKRTYTDMGAEPKFEQIFLTLQK